MATVFPTYPATTLAEAEDILIFSGNQMHEVINGDENTQIQVEDGSYIPSVRKAMKDGLCDGFGGQYRKLLVIVSGTAYQGTITADRLVVEGTYFSTKLLRNVSLSFNGATSGVNGIDAGTITAGNWYNIHVVFNPTTEATAALLSLSEAPTLPSGYTMYACVGAAYVPASTSAFLASKKRDKSVSYADIAGFVPLLDNASLNNSSLALSTSIATPPRATKVNVVCLCGTSNFSVYADPANTVPFITPVAGYGYFYAAIPFRNPGQLTLKTYVSAAGMYMYCAGYEDSV